jgi:hypothetical protein
VDEPRAVVIPEMMVEVRGIHPHRESAFAHLRSPFRTHQAGKQKPLVTSGRRCQFRGEFSFGETSPHIEAAHSRRFRAPLPSPGQVARACR